MASFGNNTNNIKNSVSSSSPTTSYIFPFLNRSLTTVYKNIEKPSQKPSLHRVGSMTKFSIDSVNSIRGQAVKKLCNIFKTKQLKPSK
ncbi:hypothetical protein TanjilG_01800 [Lupinus angustifolius]|uniref:Uncharacterized protein n=1 Tax=Lupinus angustifolius TaxID=3871 RepID=A0A1J7HWM8_LUPAN|nr:hypothetical protein TanjilG_01800 [Lupinus angustifolius]